MAETREIFYDVSYLPAVQSEIVFKSLQVIVVADNIVDQRLIQFRQLDV